jgi:hypothetical protein
MKAYNEYMNKISVSDMLHQRLMSCAASPEPRRRPVMARRYAAAFACLAVVLIGIYAIPQLMNNVTPMPGETPSVSQPSKDAPVSDASGKYTLYFNKADSQATDKIAIPGHFWQELTDEELKAVFPSLTETHNITATANFQSDECGASLFDIDAHAVSASGLKTYIQLAPGNVVLDYGFDVETKTSDVLGTAVTAGYFETKPNSKGLRNVIYFASFKLSGLGYYAELGGAEAEKETLKEEFTMLIGALIKGGTADISVFHPAIPELRNDRLSLDEARTDADFGEYLPQNVPSRFTFESVVRFINQKSNYLSALWINGMGNIHWRVSPLEEDDKVRITSVADTKNYDLALYPIPRAESVPRELREIVENPIFRIEELALDTVRARTYEAQDTGDISGPRMRFSVLYGDTLVELNVKGASAEEIFDILQQIGIH